MSRTNKKNESRPRLACEITADRVIAGRAADKANLLDACTARTLTAGAVSPSLTAVNVVDGASLRRTIGEALATVGGRSRDITVVLPDAAARVVLLDFDTLPDRLQDAEPVIRLRLKKSLPFDVDKAAISFQASRNNGEVRVVAAVTLSSVLQEYESAFRDVGFQPGIVMPATLAALGPIDASEATLVIKVDAVTTGVAIVQNQELLLFRTLENPAGAPVVPERLAEDVYPSLVFFQDTYGAHVERILVGGILGVDELSHPLEAQTGIRPQELVSATQVGAVGSTPRSLFAGVAGALIG